MAISIHLYKDDSLDVFTKSIFETDKLETGSFNAMTSAMAASLLEKAAARIDESPEKEYILRNSEILRSYFIHLVDDDIKARRGYNKELSEGDKLKTEAATHTAVAVNEEIISMCTQMLELGLKLKPLCKTEDIHYLKEMAHLAVGAVKSSIEWILNITSHCTDETYKFVVKRENELNLDNINLLYEQY